mmetsp:Transcript_65846/g.140883  ORF Transcript_65846/g.140883 Transcript_65846/m.140883 type:complete len:138 (-) Transcript_65846:100-513(-)
MEDILEAQIDHGVNMGWIQAGQAYDEVESFRPQSDNPVTSGDIAALVGILDLMETLKELDLSSLEIGDKNLKALVESMPESVEQLSVNGGGLTDGGVNELCRCLPGSVTRLQIISGSSISVETKTAMKELLGDRLLL